MNRMGQVGQPMVPKSAAALSDCKTASHVFIIISSYFGTCVCASVHAYCAYHNRVVEWRKGPGERINKDCREWFVTRGRHAESIPETWMAHGEGMVLWDSMDKWQQLIGWGSASLGSMVYTSSAFFITSTPSLLCFLSFCLWGKSQLQLQGTQQICRCVMTS